MSDEIHVRVTLDSYDVVHPQERQTQVYVQIPDVARASWLLDPGLFHGLKMCPWPGVVDAAQEDYERRGTVTDSDSAAARARVMTWLALDENRDAMQAAWEQDEARRHPVARKLLERIAELEAAAYGDASRIFTPLGQIRHLHEALAAQLHRANTLDRLLREANDRAVKAEQSPLTVFRTSYDSEEMGLWATREAARAQCEAHERTHWLGSTSLTFTWVPDADEENSPEELWASITADAEGSETGYVVTPLVAPSEYVKEADE